MVPCCIKPAILGHRPMKKRLALLVLLVLLTACDRPSEELFPNSASPTGSAFPLSDPGPSASPTPPAVPEQSPPTSGKASADCVEGWSTPPPGSPRATFPLRVIRRSVPLPGDPVVVEMRYFVGPESPPSEKGYLLEIERWYVKLYVEEDLTFQGRFLVESREFGAGVSAVAPYDTRGFRSPDWSGFAWNVSEPTPKAYPGLPGTWAGDRYDFVRGGAGLAVRGLPPEVSGCIDSA
jgi:hypothetical protein